MTTKIAVPLEMEQPPALRAEIRHLADLPRLPVTWFGTTPEEADEDDPQGQAD